MEKLQWTALEYEEKNRSTDWFWALGIIIIAGAVTAIILGNYFFALLLIIGGIMLGFFAIKKPVVIEYEINDKGIKVGTRLYPFENIKAFFVQAEPKYLLLLKTTRVFMPILSIPFTSDLFDRIHAKMLASQLPEEILKDYPAEKIMESLGF